jgi:hypothetical protein
LRRFARLPSRILAVSAATFIGAIGAVALTAAPASAHTATLTYDAVCGKTEGTADITWKVTNNQPDKVGTIKRVDREIGDIKNDAKVQPLASVTGTETVSVADGSASFSFRMRWKDADDQDVAPVTVDLAKLGCGPTEEPPKKPTASATSNCDGTLTVVVKNTTDKERTFAVNGTGNFVTRKDLKVNEEWTVVVPKENAEHPRVKMENDAGDLDTFADFNWVKPDVCFEVVPKSTCDGLEITVTNTGAKAIKATVTAGDTSESVDLPPGASDTATIDGVDGLVAKLAINDGEAKDYAWAKPSDCGTGGLPVTGANAGLLAGAALVLVSGGGGMFFLARRRRVRFAA